MLARGGHPPRGARALTRVLGARHLVEVAIVVCSRDRRPPRWSVLVDAGHAGSMIALAGRSRRLRGDALASAAAAMILAGGAELERLRA
jgi:hypothetical protein